MSTAMGPASVSHQSEFALRFFAVSMTLLLLALGLSQTLLAVFPTTTHRGPTHFSSAFAVSTGLLLLGSMGMSRAVGAVKREKQRLFRRSLAATLAMGTLFVGVQTFALTSLIRQQPHDEAQTGAGAFVAVMATLHAMHFLGAMLCLTYVSVLAFADRYDHEYYWGVTFCAWFWHALGVVWGVILLVMLIVIW